MIIAYIQLNENLSDSVVQMVVYDKVGDIFSYIQLNDNLSDTVAHLVLHDFADTCMKTSSTICKDGHLRVFNDLVWSCTYP